MIEAAQIVLVLVAFFLLPGVTWGPLIAPGTPPGLGRIGRAFGASMVVGAVAMTGLALVGLLRPPAVVLTLLVLTVAPLAVPSVRQSIGRMWRPPRRPRRLVGWAIAAAGLGLAATFLVVPSHFKLDEAPLPASTTVWYYAHLARDVADAGRFPEDFTEWGGSRPFQTDYAPFTAHSAAVFELLPATLPDALEAYRLAVLVAGFCLAVLMLRRWFSTWLAILGAVLLLGTVRIDQRLITYRPEAFAFVVALFAIHLVDRAAVERTPRMIAAAAVALGLVFASHAEVFLVVLPVAAGIALVRGPLRPANGRVGLRAVGLRRGLAGPAAVAVVVVAAVAVGALANAAVAGEFRLAGYASASLTAADVPRPPADRIPTDWELSGDPTWDFFVAATGPAERDPPTAFTDPRLLPRSTLHVWPRVDGMTTLGLAVLVALLLAPIVGWPRLDARRRRALVTWLTFGIGLFAGSYLVFALSDWYVPQRVGGRRLMPYELFVPVVAATLTIWLADGWLRPIWARLPGMAARVVPLAIGATVTLAVIAAPVGARETEEPGLTRLGSDAFDWMRANLPPDSRILTNAYTDGSVTLLSGNVGILDGRAVYLEDAEFLGETTSLLLGARTFFLEPDADAAARFLADENVDYLLVVGPDGSSSDLAGYRPFPTDFDAIAADSRYTLVQRFGEQRLMLFRVEPPGATSRSDAVRPVPL